MLDLNGIFGPDGLFAQKAPGFVHRPDQLRMARAVAALLADDLTDGQPEDAPCACACLAIEAETGLGKTLAYLAPAVLHSGRVVVSTNTRNLQDQILDREIPLLRRLLAPDLRVVCVKGRQNYLCLHRWHQLEAESEGALFAPSQSQSQAEIKKIAEWLGSTRRGDRTELAWLSGNAPLWQRICCLNHFCLGQDCADHAACFLNQLRREAAAADILVVNHHLLFSDLALRSTGFGEVLPRYESVIFDEAHHLENVATTFFGRSFSRLQTQDLAADMARTAEAEAGNRTRAKVIALARGLEQAADDFARAFPPGRGRFPLDWQAPNMAKAVSVAEETAEILFSASEDLQDLARSGKSGRTSDSGSGKAGPWQQYAERAAELADRLRFILAPDDSPCPAESPENAENAAQASPARTDAFTFWYERTERNVSVSATPVEVAGELQRTLYATARHCLFTSATLTTGGNFAYFFSRMGLGPDTPSLSLASPFDYANRTLIYLPERGFPAPAEPGYQEALHQRLDELVRVSGGRALLLFTSRQAMEAAHGALAGQLPFPVFMQGEAPRHTLLNRFSRNIKSVLFAVASFWEGVDVPGESLSLVVMDKLPFEVPSDPVVQARMRRIEEQGGKPFFAFQVPRAIFTLRQGAGRLMRSKEDRGVIAILDIRLMTKGYGRDFIRSLPPAPLTHDLARVAAFFSADKPDKPQQAATDQP